MCRNLRVSKPMTSETVYSVELVSRMTYLSANSLRGTYTGTLRRNVPSIPVTTRECPLTVRLAGRAGARGMCWYGRTPGW